MRLVSEGRDSLLSALCGGGVQDAPFFPILTGEDGVFCYDRRQDRAFINSDKH